MFYCNNLRLKVTKTKFLTIAIASFRHIHGRRIYFKDRMQHADAMEANFHPILFIQLLNCFVYESTNTYSKTFLIQTNCDQQTVLITEHIVKVMKYSAEYL